MPSGAQGTQGRNAAKSSWSFPTFDDLSELRQGDLTVHSAHVDSHGGCGEAQNSYRLHDGSHFGHSVGNHDSRSEGIGARSAVRTLRQQEEVVATISILTWNTPSIAGKEEDQVKTEDQPVPKREPPTLCRPGQLTFLCSKLREDGIDIACLQETRLSLPEGFSMATHWIAQNPAVNGHEGLIIAIDKKDDSELVSYKAVGDRILTALVRVRGTLIFVVNGHAPIRKAPAEEHERFAHNLEDALSAKPRNALLLGGADLNARVLEKDEGNDVFGPLASLCPYRAVHARHMMRTLQKRGAKLSNTFVNSRRGKNESDLTEDQDPEDFHAAITTWVHPRSKKELQIDFVLACCKAMDMMTFCATMPWAQYDMLTRSDHRAVKATILVSHTKTSKGPRKIRKHTSEEHLRAFKLRMREAIADYHPTPNSTSFAVVKELQEKAVEVMTATKPRAAQPRASWISSDTRSMMRELNRIRKILRGCIYPDAGCPWLLPVDLRKMPGFDGADFPRQLTMEDVNMNGHKWLVEYVRAMTKVLRNTLRREKRLWTDRHL
eukprot:2051923-Amphidinium_carterae.4